MTQDQILNQIIFPTIDHFADQIVMKERNSKDLQMKLFGPEGAMDSIGFVSFILSVEAKAREVSGRPISLMDTRALAQEKNPFADVAGLCSYLETAINS